MVCSQNIDVTPLAQTTKPTVLSSQRFELSSRRKVPARSVKFVGDASSRYTRKRHFSIAEMKSLLFWLAEITSLRIYTSMLAEFYLRVTFVGAHTVAHSSRFAVVKTLAQFTSVISCSAITSNMAFRYGCEMLRPC